MSLIRPKKPRRQPRVFAGEYYYASLIIIHAHILAYEMLKVNIIIPPITINNTENNIAFIS